MPVNIVTALRGAGTVLKLCPFDITLTGTGANQIVKFRPGTVNFLLPDNLLDGVPVSTTPSSIFKVKVKATSDGKSITGSTIIIDTNDPVVQTPTPFGLPSTVEILIGMIVGTKVFKVIPCGNITLIGQGQFITNANPPAQPGTLNYIQYYTWVMQ